MHLQQQTPIGRETELERIDALLDAAADGTSSAVLVMGEPGIGKSTLGAAARERAVARGFGVLQTTGVEADADMAFAGLAELLAPALDLLDSIPDSQARALRSALAIEPGDPPAPFVVAAALISVLAAAAESASGLLVHVDDAQWLDEESLGAVLFATRRLHMEGVVVVIAARPEPDRGLTMRGIEQIELTGLSDEEARSVVRTAAGSDDISDEPMRRVVEAAAGNPLALVELPRTLGRKALEGLEPLPSPVRPGAAIERAFEAQIAGLPVDTARALVVAAADETAYLDRILDAFARLGIPRSALDDAERAGAVRIEAERLRFRHPLLRSVAYHRATAEERRQAHTALADAFTGERDQSRRVFHLADAATGPDEELAAELEQSAERALKRGAEAVASHTLTRAADLTPERNERARRLTEAGRGYARIGQLATASDLAARGLALDPDDRFARANVEGLMAEIALRSGRPAEARDLWEAAAESVADIVPEESATGWLGIAMSARLVGNWEAMLRACDRVIELAEQGGSSFKRAIGEGMKAAALLAKGRVEEAEPLVDAGEAIVLDPEARELPIEVVAAPLLSLVLMERFDRAEKLMSTLIADARERSALTALIFCLVQRSLLNLRRGRLQAAQADGLEALKLAEDAQQIAHVLALTGPLAEVEAALGHERECRERAQTAIGVFEMIGAEGSAMWPRSALGLLELGLAHPEAALHHLAECEQNARATGLVNPNFVQWAANYVEALVRSGRRDDAAAAMHWLEGPGGSRWADAAADRCRGLLAEDDGEADGRFEASAEAFDRGGMPFEAARSRLCWGERLRRSRRRGDARDPLRKALATFERVGAEPWAARARDELRAAGEAVTPNAGSVADELTPHELRIALLVAEGRTNPEVAAELFNSRKTVEHHLSQIYRKLGVRSRTELARLMAGELTG
jgi:DNA-binding CsgD family transcriptional regulator